MKKIYIFLILVVSILDIIIIYSLSLQEMDITLMLITNYIILGFNGYLIFRIVKFKNISVEHYLENAMWIIMIFINIYSLFILQKVDDLIRSITNIEVDFFIFKKVYSLRFIEGLNSGFYRNFGIYIFIIPIIWIIYILVKNIKSLEK